MTKKVILDAKVFSESLDLVSHVLKKAVFPHLSEVMVSIRDGCCTLTATDLDSWLLREMPAEGDPLAFVLRHTKEVAKACRHFEGRLELELSDSEENGRQRWSLLMRCGNRAGEFEALDADSYPVYTPFDIKTSFPVNAGSLMQRIGRVSYAASRSKTTCRPSAVSVQLSGNRVYALDGHRLACDVDTTYAFPSAFMANAEALTHLKLFGNREVQVELGEQRGRFTDHATTLDFHLNGKDFFDVDTAIPKSTAEEFLVSPKVFLQELGYLKGFIAGERKPYVRFHSGELFMPVSTGTYRTSVPIAGHSEVLFAFDINRMIDALRQFKDAPQVKVKVFGAQSPLVLEADGRSDFALVCPVKLSDRPTAA